MTCLPEYNVRYSTGNLHIYQHAVVSPTTDNPGDVHVVSGVTSEHLRRHQRYNHHDTLQLISHGQDVRFSGWSSGLLTSRVKIVTSRFGRCHVLVALTR